MRKEYVIKQITNGYILRIEDGLEATETYFRTYVELLIAFSDDVSVLMKTETEHMKAEASDEQA